MNELDPVLAGCRILVTAQRRADELGGALERRGATVTVAPALGVVSDVDEAGLVRATRSIIAEPLDVAVITTGVGFRGWLETAGTAGLAEELLRTLGGVRLLARGPKARGALQAAGLRADWVAASETSAEVADFLLGQGVQGQRIAVQRHAAGDDGLHARLSGGGASVTELEVYRWGPPPDPELARRSSQELADGAYDAVLFTSAPGAAAWLAGLRDLGRLEDAVALNRAGSLLVAAVGPVTGEPLTVGGFEVSVPERWRLGALVRQVVTELGDRNGAGTVDPALDPAADPAAHPAVDQPAHPAAP